MKEQSNLCNIAVMVSGSGTNLQQVIDDTGSGKINGAVRLVITDRPDVYSVKRAENHGIPCFYVRKNPAKLLELFEEYNIELIVLAGYLSIVESEIVERYPGRIINIHPSLIPKFCGKGFYGIKVHEAVVAAGEKTSGATVHFVDSGIDTGPIIIQQTVPVYPEDTPEQLQKRVLEVEHKILSEAINKVITQWEKE